MKQGVDEKQKHEKAICLTDKSKVWDGSDCIADKASSLISKEN